MANIVQNLWQDIRFALRQLRRAPGFALTAVLTLALGIGANTAIFSLLDQALLRSLPVRDPAQLVVLRGTGSVWQGRSSSFGSGYENASFSYPMYRDLRDRDHAFAGLLATSKTDVDLLRGGNARDVKAEIVSGNYFSVLGVHPALGRLFTATDDLQPGGNPVAVLSYAFWQNDLHGDPAVVGSTISLSGHPFEVIGVAAPVFRSAVWGETPAVFVPLSMTGEIVPGAAKRLTNHKDRWINLIGRLQPGETIEAAETQSAPLWHALRAEELKALGTRSQHFVDEFLTRSRLQLEPAAGGLSYNRTGYKQPLLATMGMAVLVLLIAMMNVAGLLLVRGAGRTQEFAMRYALGAKTTRLVQQLLAEGVLLGLAGGTFALLFAQLTTRLLIHQLADQGNSTPFSNALDERLLLFNFAIALVVSVLFSLVPAWQMRRQRLANGPRQASSTVTGPATPLRRVVVSLQIGLSLLLLIGAGLFVRTLRQLRTQDVGFRTDHLAVFGVSPRLAGFAPDRVPLLEQQLSAVLAEIPGVTSVAVTNDPELADNDHGDNILLENYVAAPEGEIVPDEANVTPNYFSTLGVPLLAGRLFDSEDDSHHPLVAMVNGQFAKRYFGSMRKALGQRLMTGASNHPNFNVTIVGVVADVRHLTVRDPAGPSLYFPALQAGKGDLNRTLYVYLRGHVSPEALASSVSAKVAGIDANLAIDDLRTMDNQIDQDLSNERMIALLAVCFGVLAAVLAGVGLYGVVAFTTAQRTREIGVRIALGASRLSVSRLIMDDITKMVIGGLLTGVPLTILLGHLVRSQLYGVSPFDPASITEAVLLLVGVALLAAAVPAHRAATVNPIEALRTE